MFAFCVGVDVYLGALGSAFFFARVRVGVSVALGLPRTCMVGFPGPDLATHKLSNVSSIYMLPALSLGISIGAKTLGIIIG